MRCLALALLVSVPLAAQKPLTPFQEQKARAMLRTQLSCLGCHELDGNGGRSAPSLSTVGERRSAAYIRDMIENPQRTLPGAAMPMPVMPVATRELIVLLLARAARGPDPAPAAAGVAIEGRAVAAAVPMPARPPNASVPDGRALYAHWCASCHGADGRGDGPNAKFLPTRPAAHADAALMRARADDVLFDAISGGGAVMGKSARMPAFGATLNPAEIRSLVRHLRTLCRCEGPAWSRDAGAP